MTLFLKEKKKIRKFAKNSGKNYNQENYLKKLKINWGEIHEKNVQKKTDYLTLNFFKSKK